jgi:predicted nucleic acid-binding protein
MPPPKMFILDSNAYFRLAISIHPLLGQKFGKSTDERYVLRVIAELDMEYNRSTRLQNKFQWVVEKKFRDNRSSERLKLIGKQKIEMEQARSFIISTERDMGCNLSLVDATALAIGFVKQQPVVTDDKDMCTVATILGIEVWSLLQLMKLMLDEKHIDLDKIKEIAQLLDYENDLPFGRMEFIRQFKQFFEASPFEL